MLGISLVVKESVGIIHEGKDFGDYGYVRGYNSGEMWGGLFSQPLFILYCELYLIINHGLFSGISSSVPYLLMKSQYS